jgi:hypothetical protein
MLNPLFEFLQLPPIVLAVFKFPPGDHDDPSYSSVAVVGEPPPAANAAV